LRKHVWHQWFAWLLERAAAPLAVRQ